MLDPLTRVLLSFSNNPTNMRISATYLDFGETKSCAGAFQEVSERRELGQVFSLPISLEKQISTGSCCGWVFH